MNDSISTLRNLVAEKPVLYGGKVCDKYELLPLMDRRYAEGGLRTQGKFKINIVDKPLVTFITVVRNNEKTLKRCMESVWNQSYDNIEYILIDGASTDGTVKIIQEYSNLIDYYVSEKDNGIYDGMNKALSVASGTIITLLNSDDWADKDAAKNAVKIYNEQNYDLLAGAGVVYKCDGTVAFNWVPRNINKGTVFSGVPMLHQAIYATRNCYETTGAYDVLYKIAADYKWILKAFDKNLRISRVNTLFANFMLGGASANKDLDLNERLKLIKEYYPYLTDEEAFTLYNELDITVFWNSPYHCKDESILSSLLKKYKDKLDLVLAIGEALLVRYSQLQQFYNPEHRGDLSYKEKIRENVNLLRFFIKKIKSIVRL